MKETHNSFDLNPLNDRMGLDAVNNENTMTYTLNIDGQWVVSISPVYAGLSLFSNWNSASNLKIPLYETREI